MRLKCFKPRPGWPQRQHGMSLVELLVAAGLSMIVSGTAVILMGNAMGTSSRVIQATQLSNEVRTALQMMSRDVRRAGYTSSAMWCLANTVCLPDATINLPLGGSFTMPGGITINGTNDCFRYELDRDHDGNVTGSESGAYRRRTVAGIGVIEMWVGTNTPNCTGTDVDWVQVTDPQVTDITTFTVDDDQSFDEVVAVDLLGNTTTQRVRRIRMSITGRLRADAQFEETAVDTIDVRNDILL